MRIIIILCFAIQVELNFEDIYNLLRTKLESSYSKITKHEKCMCACVTLFWLNTGDIYL